MSEQMNRELLRFALLGVPTRVARPLEAVSGGLSVRELDASEAALLLEGVVYLQWIRTGLLGLVSGGLIALVNVIDAQPRAVWLVLPATLMIWLPAYMLGLALLRSVLLRKDKSGTFGSMGWAVTWLRTAPAFALVAAAFTAGLIQGW